MRITRVSLQTKGTMQLSAEEAADLCDRVPFYKDGKYRKDDFIALLTD